MSVKQTELVGVPHVFVVVRLDDPANVRHIFPDRVNVGSLCFSMQAVETEVVPLFEAFHPAFRELHGMFFLILQVQISLVLQLMGLDLHDFCGEYPAVVVHIAQPLVEGFFESRSNGLTVSLGGNTHGGFVARQSGAVPDDAADG